MSNLNNNTTQLELLLAKVNALPEAGGSDTSDATATADEIFAGETAYIADGKVTGTFTIAEELTEQNNLISQISTLVATKANSPAAEDLEAELITQESLISQLGTILDNKASGAGGASVKTCTMTIRTGLSATIIYTTVDESGNINSNCATGIVFTDLVGVCDTNVTILYDNFQTSELMPMPVGVELMVQTSHAFVYKLIEDSVTIVMSL